MLHSFGVRPLSAWLSCTITAVFLHANAQTISTEGLKQFPGVSAAVPCQAEFPNQVLQHRTPQYPPPPLLRHFCSSLFFQSQIQPQYTVAGEAQQDHWPAPASLAQPQGRDLEGETREGERRVASSYPSEPLPREYPHAPLHSHVAHVGMCLCRRKSPLVSMRGSVRALPWKSADSGSLISVPADDFPQR